MSIVEINEKIINFIKQNPNLIRENIYSLPHQTNDWVKGERYWYISLDEKNKYLFYFENNLIVGVFDRSKGLLNKIY